VKEAREGVRDDRLLGVVASRAIVEFTNVGARKYGLGWCFGSQDALLDII
jgi:hypothetical protein